MVDQELMELASRVESATGADIHLDASIGRATGAKYVGLSSARFPHDPSTEIYLRYTASLDAALTLVPAGWGWFATNVSNHDCPQACVTDPQEPCTDYDGEAATAPLALCAAALRARASMEGAGR